MIQDEIKARVAAIEDELTKVKKLLDNKPDPRIGKLCKVWDGDIEPDTCDAYFEVVQDILGRSGHPFETVRTVRVHARLLTEAEIDQYVRSGE